MASTRKAGKQSVRPARRAAAAQSAATVQPPAQPPPAQPPAAQPKLDNQCHKPASDTNPFNVVCTCLKCSINLFTAARAEIKVEDTEGAKLQRDKAAYAAARAKQAADDDNLVKELVEFTGYNPKSARAALVQAGWQSDRAAEALLRGVS